MPLKPLVYIGSFFHTSRAYVCPLQDLHSFRSTPYSHTLLRSRRQDPACTLPSNCVNNILHPWPEEGGGGKGNTRLPSHSPVPASVHAQANYHATRRNSVFAGLQLTTVGDLGYVCMYVCIMYSSLFPPPPPYRYVSRVDALTFNNIHGQQLKPHSALPRLLLANFAPL